MRHYTQNPQASAVLKDILFNDDPKKREKWYELLKDPAFTYRHEISFDEKRTQAYNQLKKVTDAKLFSVWDF